MGLNDSLDELVCSSSTSLPAPVAEEPGCHQKELCEEEEKEEEVQVSRVLWCCCVQVGQEVKQREACLVLTKRLLGLLFLAHDLTRTNQDRGKQTECMMTVTKNVRI